MEEDREAERAGQPLDGGQDPRYIFLSEALGVEASLARRVAVVFNDLPPAQRRVFYAVVVQGKSLNRHVAEGNGPPDRVREDLKSALLALSLLQDPGEGRGGSP